MFTINRDQLLRVTLYALLIPPMIVGVAVFGKKGLQNPAWTIPFFSGAANFQIGRGWMYSVDDIEAFYRLPSRQVRVSHRFARSVNLKPFKFLVMHLTPEKVTTT